MPLDLDTARVARTVATAATFGVMAVALAACGGGGSESPSTSSTSSSTTPPSVSPTEKSINPTGGNKFTPPVQAPAAPTAIPGNRENTG
ncbi:MAG: hypothetical protein ABW137_26445 [Mycobacterium sp.]